MQRYDVSCTNRDNVSMISSIHIKGYRGFNDFRMGNLCGVNLLVGANNSGKTSALEACYLLASQASRRALGQVLLRRGELKYDRDENYTTGYPEVDVSHLFYGHECNPKNRFEISTRDQYAEKSISVEVVELTPEECSEIRSREAEGFDPQMALRIEGSSKANVARIPIGVSGGFIAAFGESRWHPATDIDASPVRYITNHSLSPSELIKAWDSIVLTEHEEYVHDCLRILDSDIVRIAPQSSNPSGRGKSDRAGFLVRHKRFVNPIPIGSLGDGIWYILRLAIAITRCRDGFLLVDEIDTGLHYRVLPEMWKMVIDASRRLNVQVFASTHSFDCVKALAKHGGGSTLLSETSDQFVLQRIESDRGVATSYRPEEMRIALERFLEMR